MLLNEQVYKKYLEVAHDIQKAMTEAYGNEAWRTARFFPRIQPKKMPNPNYPKKEPLTPYIEEIPATPGASLSNWCVPSSLCCGLVELNGGAILPQIADHYTSAVVVNKCRQLGFKDDDIHKARFAYAIQSIADNGSSGVYGRGLMIYTCPKNGYIGHQEVLKEFGFTPLCVFANPVHNYHEVMLYGCHTPPASLHLKGDKRWDASSTTKPAKSAEVVITSESTKMEANTVSAATGGKRRIVSRKSIA